MRLLDEVRSFLRGRQHLAVVQQRPSAAHGHLLPAIAVFQVATAYRVQLPDTPHGVAKRSDRCCHGVTATV